MLLCCSCCWYCSYWCCIAATGGAGLLYGFSMGCTTGISSLNENFGVVVDVALAVLKFRIGDGGLKLNCTLSCVTPNLNTFVLEVVC